MSSNQDKRIQHIIAAFHNEAQPFTAHPQADVFRFNGRIGIRAQNQSACHQTGKRKMAYYVEGEPYEMGYLLGLMAEPDIARMCGEFNQRILFDFVHVKFRTRKVEAILGECLEILLYWLSGNIYPDIPDAYKQELEGILEGCRAANPHTGVSWQELWVLNVGIDALLSFVYTGNLPIKRRLPFNIKPQHLRVPLACNGFAVFGSAVEGDGHLLGRDFMFPTADVFQDTACLIVQNPEGKRPFVSMTAPGMIGCIAGMNIHGLGVGVDMSPSGNCEPSRPGLNSLLLARHCIEHADHCEGAVQIMEEAQRGVSWNYILADYATQSACVVEAGCKMEETAFAAHLSAGLRERLADRSFDFLPGQLVESLPEASFVEAQGQPPFRKGLMVRWHDYAYPEAYLAFNRVLFRLFRKRYNPDAFAESGYIDRSWRERNCPYGYYFAPQREQDPQRVLVTNMYIIPEMRLFAMHPWTNLIASDQYDDLQWRYDELNHLLSTKLSELSQQGKKLTVDEAKEIIDFLTPDPDKGAHPEYYNPKPKRSLWRRLLARLRAVFSGQEAAGASNGDWRSIQVFGSVSLMDLKEKTMHSHYGYYGDAWVQIRLQEYIDDAP